MTWHLQDDAAGPILNPHINVVCTLRKFNSSPLKSYRNPIGKDRLPTTIFQGRAVKLREGMSLFVFFLNIGFLKAEDVGIKRKGDIIF